MDKYCTGCIFRHREDSDSLCDMVENRNYNADEENCPYHLTKQEEIQVAMYKVNEEKKFVQEQEMKKKEVEEEILSRRFELHFYRDAPWSFRITNRFTDEQIQDFINNEYIPSKHLSFKDDIYEYNKSKEELTIAVIGSVWLDIFHPSNICLESDSFIGIIDLIFKNLQMRFCCS